MPRRVEFTVSEELFEAVEKIRGDESRASFIKAAIVQLVVARRAERAVEKPASVDDIVGRLKPHAATVLSAKAPPERNVATPPEVMARAPDPAEAAGLNRFKCGCVTSATSPKACCPRHGRSLRV